MDSIWITVLLVAATAFFSFRAGQMSVVTQYKKTMQEQAQLMHHMFSIMSQCQDLFDDLEQGKITISQFQEKMDQRLEQLNQKD